MYERLELYIETLTGTAFELKVSPFETVQDIKARIQKLEGIPISQQHLIWQSRELDDESCISACGIHDRATLKLVLTMRGGPINTRRIPMDDPYIREMAEYLNESNQDELYDKVSNRPVTVIVYHNGDQLNFFRVVDRESTSPMSESLSGASMYNLYDDEEEDEKRLVTHEQLEENDKTKEKMKLLRLKMQNLTVSKKEPKKKVFVPHPPVHPFSSDISANKSRLRHISSARKRSSFNHNKRLPPVGQNNGSDSSPRNHNSTEDSGSLEVAKELFQSAASAATSSSNLGKQTPSHKQVSVESSNSKLSLSSVKEDHQEESAVKMSESAELSQSDNKFCDMNTDMCYDENLDKKPVTISKQSVLRRAQSSLKASRRRGDFSQEVLLKEPRPPAGSAASSCQDRPQSSSFKGLERLLETTNIDNILSHQSPAPSQSRSNVAKNPPSRAPSTNRHRDRRQLGVVLESLNPSEVQAMSGMLSSLVHSANRSRAGFTLHSPGYKDHKRIPTPEDRLLSARLRGLSASRDGHVLSPTHRLPPVKQKKKSKRCFVCQKKTGLTNSYPCRCSHNFCATHRYPEAHSCTFDYKTEGRKLIEQNNPVVNAPKLPKI